MVWTRVHTPRRWGAPFSAGVFVLSVLDSRPWRTSCWMVGTPNLSGEADGGRRTRTSTGARRPRRSSDRPTMVRLGGRFSNRERPQTARCWLEHVLLTTQDDDGRRRRRPPGPRPADARARRARGERPPPQPTLPGGPAHRRVRDGLLLGRRAAVLADRGRVVDRRRLRWRVHPESLLPGGLQRPDRSRRGRPGGVRPGRRHL